MISSVPLLGPRLTVLETLKVLTPRTKKYEGDLRDQWQSRTRWEKWQRMHRLMCKLMDKCKKAVTVLSGTLGI